MCRAKALTFPCHFGDRTPLTLPCAKIKRVRGRKRWAVNHPRRFHSNTVPERAVGQGNVSCTMAGMIGWNWP